MTNLLLLRATIFYYQQPYRKRLKDQISYAHSKEFFRDVLSLLFQMEMEVSVAPEASSSAPPTNLCVRAGCTNPAVESRDWDKEYCSNECVATHCRFVFCVHVLVYLFLFVRWFLWSDYHANFTIYSLNRDIFMAWCSIKSQNSATVK